METAEDGLGPAFNGNSCAVCHSVPAIGGISTMTEVRGGYRDEDGKFHALNGGTLYHLFSTPPHRCQVQIPPEANVIARRAPIPLFGAGLVEAIADETILALEDPDDRDGDGIRGRAARIIDVVAGRERIGRFGWKAQQATLLAFSGDAYRNEMGITNDLFPDEVALGVDAERLKLCSPKRGIEDVRNRRTGMRGIDNFENFMKFLAPIERGPIDAEVRAGEAVFQATGCAVVPRSGVDHRGESQSGVRPEAGCAVFGSAAARCGHRRRNRAVGRRSRRDPHAGTVGTAFPAPAAA